MASDTKAGTKRRKSSTESKTTVEPKKKVASKTVAPAKTEGKVASTKVKATKTAPVKATKTAAPKAAAVRKPRPTGQPITADARLRHIEVAAYYIAEKSGFSRDPGDCWTAAECEVDGLLLAGKL